MDRFLKMVGFRSTTYLLLCASLGLLSTATAARAETPDQGRQVKDYDQWQEALGAEQATEVGRIATLPGYEVKLIRTAQPDEGSWVALAFDPKGRLTIAREDKGLLRLSLPGVSQSTPVGSPAAPQTNVEQPIRVETINDTLLECRGLLYAHGYLFVNANNSRGFYRLQDTTADGRFDEVKLLRPLPGDVGHGRNNLTLGPDGLLYLVLGNDTRLPADFQPSNSPYRNAAEDRLLPCEWNKQLFNYGVTPPAGHVIRTDVEGRRWEVVAGGMRNPFGIDFNSEGEMFTFDADMEWDVGLPWYRPCQVNHLVSGGEYGWRQGTSKWAPGYPDRLPSTLDIGLASPTSVQFGADSDFPPRYRRALFMADWAYGKILAVHLTPQGASYRATAETFLRGRPLNVTGLTFGPDGAMYFITGGRKTQSGLYRLKYVGPTQPDDLPTQPSEPAAAKARQLRHKLESFHGRVDPAAVDLLWPHLGSADPWLRHAARVALEMQPVSQWQTRALSEPASAPAATALLALARVGASSVQIPLLNRLTEMAGENLSPEQQLVVVRAVQLSLSRQGSPDAATQAKLLECFDALYPAAQPPLNQLLCELLVWLESPQVVSKTLPLLAQAETQEEKIHYLFTLRHVRNHWRPDLRQLYFRWLAESAAFQGGRYVPLSLAKIKADALATLSAKDAALYRPILEHPPAAESGANSTVERPFVREWTVDDLVGSLDGVSGDRDLARGEAMFAAANCIGCHRFAGKGQTVGPDLSGVAGRFSRRDILESILVPSKAIGDKYRNLIISTDEGRVVTGALAGDDGETLYLMPDATQPDQMISIPKQSIETQQFSLTSPMPTGALDTLTKDEILDLLAYLETVPGSAARPDASVTTQPRATEP